MTEKLAAQIFFAFIADTVLLLSCIMLNKELLFSFLVGSKGKKEANRIKANAVKSRLFLMSYIEPHIEQQKRIFLKYKKALPVLYLVAALSVAVFIAQAVLIICDCLSYARLLIKVQLLIAAATISVMVFFRTKFSSLHVSKYERRLNKIERERGENK